MAENEKPADGNVAAAAPAHQLNLSEAETAIIDRQLNGIPTGQVQKRSVLAYATKFDVLVLVVSIISAIIAGALNPLLTVLYGQMVGSFHKFQSGTLSGGQLNHEIAKFNLYFLYLAVGIFVFIYISTAGFYYSGERIIRKLRYAYLQAILRQNMAFFDTLGAGEVTTRITSDMNIVQEGVTSKISLSLTAAATFIAAYVIAFVEYWKLALILTSTIVVMLAAGTTGGKLAFKNSRESLKHSSGSANVADESIGSIRVVSAFGIQGALAEKYHSFLKKAEKPGIKARISIAFMICFMNGLPFLSYGLSFWQGGRYFLSGHMSAAAVVTLTMAIVIGAFAIGRVAPNTQAFMSSMASGSGILRSMQRRSPLDPLSSDGEAPEDNTTGEIALAGVNLVYPSRKDVAVLRDVTFSIPAKKTTAIVGPTGCGKSSIVGLLERFYEPTGGRLTLDGRDIQELNLRWLRSQIAYVGQEPTLFNDTIFENIRHGLAHRHPVPQGKELENAVTQAAKDANAHDFIVALPEGYDTVVGEKGLQLSGGQRQRIAIARALVRNPAILILDEATSALDSRAERIVQNALDAAAVGRTVISIAHRLSTIRNADQIIVLEKGAVIEQGKHDDLMAQDGLYAKLVRRQHIAQEASEANHMQEGIEMALESAAPVTQEKGAIDAKIPIVVQETVQQSAPKKPNSVERLSMWQFGRLIYSLNRAERGLMLFGLFGSILAGLGTPVQGIFFAKLIDAMSLPRREVPSEMSFWALMYLMLGIVAISSWFGQGACFAFSSERLIRRAKETLFKTILRQEIGFFDAHGTGELTMMLAQDTTHLAGLDGAVLGSILTFISTIIGGMVLSLIIGWKLALVCIATMPIVVGLGYMRLIILSLFDRKVRQTQAESAAYAAEAVAAIRTVASLSLEDHVLDRYGAIMDRDAADSLRSIIKASALYAASQSVVMLCGSLVFWYGGTLIASREYTMLQFFICFSSLITGSQTAGAVFSFAPDMSKALQAGARLKEVLDRRPAIDTSNPTGKVVGSCSGSVEVENVSFRYPTRPERLVLDQVSLSVKPGQTIALVGPSGCGKSTIIALLERFFEPESGHVLVDGDDISTLNVNEYRSMISFVGQEPTVYSGTIRENIVLGSDPAKVTEEAVVQACKDANVYEFILSLPDGFNTLVGSRGSMLSGGQKQRLTIARALLRNPKILLLDEATSALDSESERLVQDALDKASQHRTTITVAHRLSTIQKADMIYVLDKGRVVEKGTHEELMAKRTEYFQLVQMQNLQSLG